MKVLLRIAFLMLSLLSVLHKSEAQELKIYNQSETKILDYNKSWYIVTKLGDDPECCNSRRMLGHLISESEDSIQLAVRQLQTRKTDSEKSYLSTIKYSKKNKFPVYTLSKGDIMNIEKKTSGFKEVLLGTGGLLFVTSLVTALHGFIVDGDDRKAVLLSSGIQFGASIALITIGTSKEKYKIADNAWQF